MGAFAQMLGMQEPCPGEKWTGWRTVKCTRKRGHKGKHENGKHTWDYGTW